MRLQPTHHHVWAIDFVHCKLSNGRSCKMLTILDEYTREALCVAARSKVTANDVLVVLHPGSMEYVEPDFIRFDNRPDLDELHFQEMAKNRRHPTTTNLFNQPMGERI
jgi:putative transposase